MKINFSFFSFGNKNIHSIDGNYNVKETFDDNHNLIRLTRYDEKGRDIDTFEYNDKKEITAHQHKKYTSYGLIETYKNEHQEYRRIIKNEKRGSFVHHIEEFISKTSPKNNYVNEFIRDLTGKLVKIINNGKIIYSK